MVVLSYRELSWDFLTNLCVTACSSELQPQEHIVAKKKSLFVAIIYTHEHN